MKKEDEKKDSPNRRYGFCRRLYHYAHHIPERRNGVDRRTSENDCPEPADARTSEENGQKTSNSHLCLDKEKNPSANDESGADTPTDLGKNA